MNFILKVYRGTPGKQFWEEFELPIIPGMTLIAALMRIRKNPVNRRGEATTPVVWEDGCLEEVCGSCSMLVNGWPRQACSAIVERILAETERQEITLAPFTKFPLVRDLVVDRSAMFEALKRVHAWIDVDAYFDRGPGPRISQEMAEVRYILSTCMTCGCCSEACPQVNSHSPFIGPAPISQARLFNAHPTGAMQQHERTQTLMEKGGVSDCGNAQNCSRVCPKKIPLTESIGVMGRQVVKEALHNLFGQPDT
jgi:succinate dehydrogenase / fumarate reductase, iron-sulfur subunit